MKFQVKYSYILLIHRTFKLFKVHIR